MKKFTKMKVKDYTVIRALIDAGASTMVIQKATGRSYPVVSRIRKTRNWEDYLKQVREANAKYQKKPQNSKPNGTQPSTIFKEEEKGILRVLVGINSELIIIKNLLQKEESKDPKSFWFR